MNSRPQSFLIPVLALFVSAICVRGAEPPKLAYFYDEEGMRYLTLRQASATGVEVVVRWASEPGSTGMWTGQGNRKDNVVTFAAVVEEGQDRGSYFIAKGGESKMEILFKPGQKMPQDPGILGIYRRVSDEKRLQLARKEYQAADERLNAALKEAAHTWSGVDKLMPAEWKSRWPALLGRWMKISYQPPEPEKVEKPAPPTSTGKDTFSPERDVQYWLKYAQVTAAAYGFIQQSSVMKSSSWDGEYDDGFGGHVSIRRAKDGKLRVNLTCTRVNENQGADLAGQIPAEAVKSQNDENTAAAVFIEPDVPENAKEVSITLKRKGGFLWVETKRKASPPGSLSWFDGIYRWSAVPVE